MELIRFGVDTVRAAWELASPLPMESPEFRADMAAAGWSVNVRTERNDHGEVFEGRTGFWQSDENSSIRAQVQNGGRILVSEFSVPRVLSNSLLNLDLATWDEVQEVTHHVVRQIEQNTPMLGVPFRQVADSAPRWRRADLAADVAAHEARPGLIAAAGRFVLPRVKTTRQVFPGETARVSSQSLTFRTYDKAREMCNKTDALLIGLEPHQRLDIVNKIEAHRASGAVRLELAMTPKKGGLSGEDMAQANIKWADVVETGFSGGRVYIGGLDRIREQIDARRKVYESPVLVLPNGKPFRRSVSGDLSAQGANSLLAFAVRYAQLGEDGMLQIMSRATYYRHRKAFLDAGLSLDDLTTYQGEIDLTPVIKQVRAG